jgi:asparagine synthetase B (glutamine-hydrolysing)
VIDGEIYNHTELRRELVPTGVTCDTSSGMKVQARLTGMREAA